MKRWIGLALILVPILVPAASFWDGNAALQRGDAVFEGGMFAASNSFAPDTQVVVRNLETGKTVTVTITQRVQSQSDILVLLSPAAAAALGIKSGTLASVRVTIPPRAGGSSPSTLAEQTISQDPDLNPGAAFGRPQAVSEAPAQSVEVAQVPSLESLPAAQAPATEAKTPQPADQPSTQQAGPQAAPSEAGPTAGELLKAEQDAMILSDAAARSPQKQVFLPPREDKTFAYQTPEPQPGPEVAQAAHAEPTITAVIGEPGAAPAPAAQESSALAEAAAPEESRPEEIVGSESTPPAESAETAVAVLPSPEPLAQAQGQGQAQAQGQAPRISGTGSWYVQLAAYATEKGAQDLASKLAPTYPALVIAPASAGSKMFRVVVGPLNKAESGTLLVWFRFRGFPDAFMKLE